MELEKTTFISALSSIHPIDLSTLVMLYAYKPFNNSQIKILIMDEAEVPEVIERKILSSRLSLPTPLLLLENEETYRQVFIPIFSYDSETNLDSLNTAINLYINKLMPNVETSIIEAILERVNIIVKSNTPNSGDPIRFYSGILKTILENALCQKVYVDLYSEFISSEQGKRVSILALRKVIDEIYQKGVFGKEIHFIKGGYILIKKTDDPAGEDIKFDYAKLNSLCAVFYNHDNDFRMVLSFREPEYSFKIYKSDSELVEKSFLLELRGPLHMAFQSQLGTPIDMPWYCEIVSEDLQGNFAFQAIEAISPVSCASQERTSKWIGGEGLRLDPSGYSLLDYNHSSILSFTSSVAGLEAASFDIFSDWRFLLNNYPPSKQKALKHQGGVSQFIQHRLKDIRTELRDFSTAPLDILVNEKYNSPAYLGLRMICLNAAIKYLRDTMETQNISWSSEQLGKLAEIGFLREGLPAFDSIFIMAKDLIYKSRKWRQKIAKPKNIIQNLDKSNVPNFIQEIANAFSDENNISMDDIFRCPGLLKYNSFLLTELILYYKAVMALSASVLKANIWTTWLILGSDDYLETCKNIISMREKDHQILRLSSQLWEVL